MGIMASIAASIGVVHVTMDDMSSVGYYKVLSAILVRNPFVIYGWNVVVPNFINFVELSFADDVKVVAGTFSYVRLSSFYQ